MGRKVRVYEFGWVVESEGRSRIGEGRPRENLALAGAGP